MASRVSATLGAVVSLWRYPVKSMMGEELNASDADDRGLLGDRSYALIDSVSGKIASAKNPKTWPNLLDFRAAFTAPPQRGKRLPAVRITLPDGAHVISEQADANQVLSLAVGREVTLANVAPANPSLEEYWPDIEGLAHHEAVTDESVAMAAPPGTFFDLAPIHLLTTATLDRLREFYPQGRFEVRRFRPNVVVEVSSGEKGFPERNWVGRTLTIGQSVRLQIAIPCPRCVMTTLAQADLPYDPGILRTAAQHTGRFEVEGHGTLAALVGVYATVVRGGTVSRGNTLQLE